MGYQIMKAKDKYSRKHLKDMVDNARSEEDCLIGVIHDIEVYKREFNKNVYVVILNEEVSSNIRKELDIEDELHLFKVDSVTGLKEIRLVDKDDFITLNNENILPIYHEFYEKYQERNNENKRKR